MASPVADQILAAIEEVDRACGGNAVLMEDHTIGTLVEFALGRLTAAEEIDERAGIQARVIPCNRDYAADALSDGRNPNHLAQCDRCMQEPASSRIWIPAGGSIVSVEIGSRCRWDLDANFSPLVWRD